METPWLKSICTKCGGDIEDQISGNIYICENCGEIDESSVEMYEEKNPEWTWN